MKYPITTNHYPTLFTNTTVNVKKIKSINPIRSGLFQTVNDPGGGGALKAPPPPTISKTIMPIFTISYM